MAVPVDLDPAAARQKKIEMLKALRKALEDKLAQMIRRNAQAMANYNSRQNHLPVIVDAIHLQCSPGNLLPQQNWMQPLSSQSLQASKQKLRLKLLLLERKLLKLRQIKIMKQQEMLQRLGIVGLPPAGMDPLLSWRTERFRQMFAGSRLGMGNGYSPPRTPEDLVANMDGVSEGGNPSGMATPDDPDTSSLSDSNDSTDLVSSLQVSGDPEPNHEVGYSHGHEPGHSHRDSHLDEHLVDGIASAIYARDTAGLSVQHL